MHTWIFHVFCCCFIWLSSSWRICSLSYCVSVWYSSWWTLGRWFPRCWAWTWPALLFLTMKSSNVLKDWSIPISITLSRVLASKMWVPGKTGTCKATENFFIEHRISWGAKAWDTMLNWTDSPNLWNLISRWIFYTLVIEWGSIIDNKESQR